MGWQLQYEGCNELLHIKLMASFSPKSLLFEEDKLGGRSDALLSEVGESPEASGAEMAGDVPVGGKEELGHVLGFGRHFDDWVGRYVLHVVYVRP